jgi:serine/threonine protein kinase/Tol biopolymer transport system component
MTIASGARLGVYEIGGPLGAGGMGEVYRARDTKLNRDVAIKVLPEIFAHQPEHLSRFEREALALASLNHPHIAQIYGVEEAGGMRALVMELVEGPTLADRIASGPIPLGEALPIARQIAEALEAAHERGIIHRDLKPANIKVRADGTVKVLDFGLAKSTDPPGDSGAALANSPTFTSPATHLGVILGTAAYMAPEQAKGKAVDKRADIWAFGVVLFETLTGRPIFDGETITDVLAAVVTRDPDWDKLSLGTPPSIRRLLRRCLERDPTRRLRDIGDARTELDDAISGADGASTIPVRPAASPRQLWPWALTTILIVALAIVLWRQSQTPAFIPQRTTRFTLATQPLAVLDHAASPAVALSPDGTHLAYVAGNSALGQLYVRRMGSLESTPIAGAEQSSGPFFSPNSEWLAFFARDNLQKVSLRGGPPVNVCARPSLGSHGGSWGDDGTIVFESGGGRLWRVSAEGGSATPVVAPAGAYWPEILPGSKAIVFTQVTGRQGIWVLSLKTGQAQLLVPDLGFARYVHSGHLVYASQGSLLAVSFDVESLQLAGSGIPVVQHAMMGLPDEPRIAHFAASHSGTLAYLAGPVLASDLRTLVWVDRKGQETTVPLEARTYAWPRLSRDGTRLAVTISDAEDGGDVWIYHLARQTLTRLTFGGASREGRPVWTPDGRRVAFRVFDRGSQQYNLFWKAADGTGQDERLTSDPNRDRSAQSFSPDGSRLVFAQSNERTGYDIHVLDVNGQRSSKPLLQQPFNEGSPEISPNGRWLAYRSNETGRYEVYVRPFPDVDKGKWPISTNGGNAPVWSPDGRELFYQIGNTIMAAPAQADGINFVSGTPTVLFSGLFASPVGTRHFDVSRDGRRFIMSKEVTPTLPPSERSQLTVVLNWFEELRQLAPTAK